MYNKLIYQEWEMHPDATQLEIKYKFLVKIVDILSIKSLIENDEGQKQISDLKIIKKWQNFALEKAVDEFYTIINDASNIKSQISNSYSTFESSIFLIGIVLNELKKTNYKANELEIYYEPRMFAVAQKILKMDLLEKWVSMMSNRVYNAPATKEEELIDLTITINKSNINNVIWYLENLCLSFKDIATWYNNLFSISNVNENNKSIAINTMNHLIVYYLTDFYVKLNYLYSKSNNFTEIYLKTLSSIKTMLEQSKFAINAFRSIANFLARILADGYINFEDHMVNDFLEVIRISCSFNNQKYFEETIFQFMENQSDKSEESDISKLKDKYNQTSIFDVNDDQKQEETIKVNESSSNSESKQESEKPISNNINEVGKINISSYKAFKQANQKPEASNNNTQIIRPTTSFNNKAKDIAKNVVRQFNQLNEKNVDDEQAEDEIQKIIKRKTNMIINSSKPTTSISTNTLNIDNNDKE